MSVGPCRKMGNLNTTFEGLKSNAVGDPYVDAGQYDLRKAGPRGAGSGCINSISKGSNKSPPQHSVHSGAKAFGFSGSNKLVRKSEFEHMHNGPPALKNPEKLRGFMSTKTPEPFTNMNTIGYAIDPYERNQDLARTDYAKQNNSILHRDQPF
jgi:hypothetical protein